MTWVIAPSSIVKPKRLKRSLKYTKKRYGLREAVWSFKIEETHLNWIMLNYFLLNRPLNKKKHSNEKNARNSRWSSVSNRRLSAKTPPFRQFAQSSDAKKTGGTMKSIPLCFYSSAHPESVEFSQLLSCLKWNFQAHKNHKREKLLNVCFKVKLNWPSR